jgi:hypothetical protein
VQFFPLSGYLFVGVQIYKIFKISFYSKRVNYTPMSIILIEGRQQKTISENPLLRTQVPRHGYYAAIETQENARTTLGDGQYRGNYEFYAASCSRTAKAIQL